MLNRFQIDVIDLKPHTVVLLAGINDIVENSGPITVAEIAQNIFKLIEWAAKFNITVVLCAVLPANGFPWSSQLKPQLKIRQLNYVLKEYAAKHGLVYIDYYSAMVSESYGLRNELGFDGIHPNAEGYSIMEPLLENVLSKVVHTSCKNYM